MTGLARATFQVSRSIHVLPRLGKDFDPKRKRVECQYSTSDASNPKHWISKTVTAVLYARNLFFPLEARFQSGPDQNQLQCLSIDKSSRLQGPKNRSFSQRGKTRGTAAEVPSVLESPLTQLRHCFQLLVAWDQAWHTSRRKLQQLFFTSRVITTSSLAILPSSSTPEIKKHYSRRVCQMRTSTKQIRIMGRKIGQGKCVFPRPRNSQTNRRSDSNRGFVG